MCIGSLAYSREMTQRQFLLNQCSASIAKRGGGVHHATKPRSSPLFLWCLCRFRGCVGAYVARNVTHRRCHNKWSQNVTKNGHKSTHTKNRLSHAHVKLYPAFRFQVKHDRSPGGRRIAEPVLRTATPIMSRTRSRRSFPSVQCMRSIRSRRLRFLRLRTPARF